MKSSAEVLKIFIREGAGFLLGFFLLLPVGLYAQNQAIADSLENVLSEKTYREEDYLDILDQLAANHTDPEKILSASKQLIETARLLDSTRYAYKGLIHQGDAFRLIGNLPEALKSYTEAASVASDKGLTAELGRAYVTIADVYSVMDNHQNAIEYYGRAIRTLRAERDSVNLASALLNAGDEYFNYGQLDSALMYFRESGDIFRALEYQLGVAYNLGNVGLVYAQQQRDSLAESNLQQAITYLESLEDYYPVSVYLLYLSDIHARQGNYPMAIDYAERSLELARQYGFKEEISQAHLKLSEIYEETGAFQKSLDHFKEHITNRDSIKNVETVQMLADLRTDFEVSQKQIEIDLLEKESELQQLREARQRYLIYAAGIALLFVLLLTFGLYRRYYYIKRTSAIIEKERKRSDELLRNILPAETARELKQNGQVRAKRFESVTVLFTDFKEFTHLSQELSPEKLVDSIDYYFSRFDEIMEKYGLEKIKTVGDAYMCAGGLPFVTEDHPQKMVAAALEIMEFVQHMKGRSGDKVAHFDLRIGINTGPVIAGVVGIKKFAYDIWGDTVNIAARMETSGEIGKINVSEYTYRLIREEFDCRYRGEIEVRNKGMMKMYFVEGLKTSVS
ncbi:MAG: adenylate/guanylate cyclase domain-containing protein [Saprospiraceae bacterium]|nr:adenylate/guanylate cyclase domain-containing protein [Saprospiraceae bacterium]